MRHLGHVVAELLTRLQAFKPNPLRYLEVGTTWTLDPMPPTEPNDARSTVAVARWLRKNQGSGVTIDLHGLHLATCHEVLLRDGWDPESGQWEFLCGDGADMIPKAGMVDFCLLDGDSNHESTFREFQAVRSQLVYPAFVVVDDVNRNGVNKAKWILEYLEREKDTHTIREYRLLAPHILGIPFGEQARRIIRDWPWGP